MMTIQKPKRTWQKKKDYMRKKTIRGLRRKGMRILQSFDDGTDDKKYYLYDTSERLHDSNAIIEYPEAKDGPVITLQGSYPSIQEYYLGRKWRGGASPFGTIQNMQDFLTDRDFARFANATRAYGNGEGISGFWNGLTDNPDYTGAMEDPGTAFLMKPSRQAEFLNKLGYIEDARPIGRNMIKGPYEALYNYTGKYIPTYRKGQDDEQPENVESISDTDIPEGVSKQKSPEDSAERSLVHAGYYPTGYFKSKEGDKYYQMDIDLNDYGQHEASDVGGTKSAYKQDARSTIANLYDYFGNPFVQRSGLRKLAGKPNHDSGKDYFDIGTDDETQQISSTQRIVDDGKYGAYIEDSSKPIALTNDPNVVTVRPNVFVNNDTGEYIFEQNGQSIPLEVYDKAGTDDRALWTYKMPNGQLVTPHKYGKQLTIASTKEPELELTNPEFDMLVGGKLGDFSGIVQALKNIKIPQYRLKVPINKNSYYRVVNGREAIDDANISGIIRRPEVTGSYNFPYFTKGQLYSDQNSAYDFLNPYIIESKSGQGFHYVRDGVHIIEPERSIEIGNSATPFIEKDGKIIYNVTPSENFVYWQKGTNPISKYFWKRKEFDKHDSGKDIHIKKANRGKFTEAANEHNMGVQEFARQVLSAPKGKYSSTLRKRANFARNFAH